MSVNTSYITWQPLLPEPMIVRRWKKPEVVTLTCTIGSVSNHIPMVGFSSEIEKAWRSLARKHKLKKRRENQLCKTASTTEVDTKKEESTSSSTVVKSSTEAYRMAHTEVHLHLLKHDIGHFVWNRSLDITYSFPTFSPN